MQEHGLDPGLERIKSRTFNELRSGDRPNLVRMLTCEDIEVFAIMPGDRSGGLSEGGR